MALFSSDPLAPFKDEFRALLAEFDSLSMLEGERIRRFKDYRAEIEATRQTDLDVSVGELDYGRRTQNSPEFERHRFQLPLAQALTVKHAYRIAGRLPDAIVDRREETPEERHRSDVMEKIWWSVVRGSNGDAQFASAAWTGSQLGAACIEVYLRDRTGFPYFRAIDPASVLVVKGALDPHEFTRLYRFWEAPVSSVQNEYRGKQFRGIDIPVNRITASSPKDLCTIVQTSDQEKALRFVISGDGKNAVPVWEDDHRYGFVPYVVIPNLGPEERVWGWADYEFTREIGRYVPVALGREADVLKLTSNGAYVGQNVGQSSASVRAILAEGGVLQVKKDGKIEPIQPPQMPAFAESHLERSLELFRMLGFAPGAAWGEGGAQSGTDRGLQLGPLLELTGLKQLNWGGGLSRVAEQCFKMIEKKQGGDVRFHGVARRGAKRVPFGFVTGPDQTATLDPGPSPDGQPGEALQVPMSPAEIFAGDHTIRFNWQARLDQDDPAYVASEINKFAQGVQSLRTTLERLGFDAPEDEITLIEQEAERHPWLRQGMIKLLEIQLASSQQGQGGGQPFDQAAAIGGASDTMNADPSGSQSADAMAGALQGGTGTLYGAA